jgi:hypothetical protein
VSIRGGDRRASVTTARLAGAHDYVDPDRGGFDLRDPGAGSFLLDSRGQNRRDDNPDIDPVSCQATQWEPEHRMMPQEFEATREFQSVACEELE